MATEGFYIVKDNCNIHKLSLDTYESNQDHRPSPIPSLKSNSIANFWFMIDILWQEPSFCDNLNVLIGPLK